MEAAPLLPVPGAAHPRRAAAALLCALLAMGGCALLWLTFHSQPRDFFLDVATRPALLPATKGTSWPAPAPPPAADGALLLPAHPFTPGPGHPSRAVPAGGPGAGLLTSPPVLLAAAGLLAVAGALRALWPAPGARRPPGGWASMASVAAEPQQPTEEPPQPPEEPEATEDGGEAKEPKGAQANVQPWLRQTSIICTLGPSLYTVEMLGQLIDSGMDIARLNFSHGEHAWFRQLIANWRQALAERPTETCLLALDTKGPEMRTGELLAAHVTIEAGSRVTLTTEEEYRDKGTASRLYVNYAQLPATVEPGGLVYIDDGQLALRVLEVSTTEVQCEALNSATLSGRRGVNLPDCQVKLPAVSEKDAKDIVFGVEQGVDVIFASFIRSRAHVLEIKSLLQSQGASHIQVISKIENQEGIDNFDEILEVSDGVMIARGDLGIEIPVHQLFRVQKELIRKCNLAGKPVICATQMLESMVSKPRPLRAEQTDVANAVLDGADCLMLSGETAQGRYPFASVRTMSEIIMSAEQYQLHDQVWKELQAQTPRPLVRLEAVALSAVCLSYEADIAAIVVLSESNDILRYIAKYRPRVPVIAIADQARRARQGLLLRGVVPLLVPQVSADATEIATIALQWLVEQNVARPGQQVVCIHKAGPGLSGATGTSIHLVEV